MDQDREGWGQLAQLCLEAADGADGPWAAVIARLNEAVGALSTPARDRLEQEMALILRFSAPAATDQVH